MSGGGENIHGAKWARKRRMTTGATMMRFKYCDTRRKRACRYVPTGFAFRVFILSLALAGASGAQNQKPLTNEDVLALITAGLDEDTIIMRMETGSTVFDISA